MEKTIKIFTKECLTKDGKKFLTYSTKIKNTFYRVKFTRDVDTLPKKQGYYNLTFDTSYASIQKQKVDLANNAFNNYNDICLEIGMGKGNFLLQKDRRRKS